MQLYELFRSVSSQSSGCLSDYKMQEKGASSLPDGVQAHWNSSTTDGGNIITAVQHTATVNVHMHNSPANQNADPKSSANTSGQATLCQERNRDCRGVLRGRLTICIWESYLYSKKKKGVDVYTIKYDNAYKKLPIYLTQVPAIHKMKSFLKRAIACADEWGYRYSKDIKKKKKKRYKEASEKHNADEMSTSKGSYGGSSLLKS
eukprot:8563581-Ditylum_brightwellii.AAC.1